MYKKKDRRTTIKREVVLRVDKLQVLVNLRYG